MSSSSETESESLVRKSPDKATNPLASDSHPPKTLTLESPNQTPLDLDGEDDASEDIPSPPPSAGKTAGISVYRRRAKRKTSSYRKRKGPQKKKKSTKKLEVLIENLKPIPFSPEKDLDFSSHEKLLKRLGLWDFVHLEFDREIRSDLVAQLIATFNPSSRGSYVNDAKVMVNRADLARALKLPARKGVATAESADPKESEESIAFILELVSHWVFLHDDTYMVPREVLNWMNIIKDGNLEKLDWATMMWFMVEKELMRAPQLTDCYYASHLQCLIRSQKEELLLPEAGGSEDESLVEIDVKEDYREELEEEVDAAGDSCMKEAEDNVDPKADDLQEKNTELSLAGEGEGNVVTEHDLKLSLGGEDETGEEAVEKVNEEAVEKVEDRVVEKVGEEVVEKVDEEVVEKVDEEVVEKAHEEAVEKEGKDEGKETEEERVGDVNLMDYEGCKEENDEPDQWLFGKGDDGNSGLFLRQCSFGVELNKDLGYEDERQREGGDEEEVGREEDGEEEEEEELEEEERGDIEEDEEEEMDEEEQEEDLGDQDGDFHISPKGLSLEAFPSEGLLHSLEGGHMSLGSGMPIRDPLAGDFVSSRDDLRMPTRHIGTSKREMSHEDDHHNLHFSNKRFRMDGTWDNGKSSSEEDTCPELQIQVLAGKAMARRIAKEQEAAMSQQILMSEVQQRDNAIEHLQKARAEERNMKDMEVYRLDQELRMMDSLLRSYRSALKETRKAYADYRARYPKPHDPVYKEVAGTGGLVISATELEKQRLKREEEDRMILLDIQTQLKDFEEWWDRKFTEFGDNVNAMANKLLSLEEGTKLLKESHAKRKLSKPPECTEADS